jgi:hypothetical protein
MPGKTWYRVQKNFDKRVFAASAGDEFNNIGGKLGERQVGRSNQSQLSRNQEQRQHHQDQQGRQEKGERRVLKSLAATTRLARMLLESQLEGSRRHRSYAQHRLRHRYQRCRGHDYLGTGDDNGKRYTNTKTPTRAQS